MNAAALMLMFTDIKVSVDNCDDISDAIIIFLLTGKGFLEG